METSCRPLLFVYKYIKERICTVSHTKYLRFTCRTGVNHNLGVYYIIVYCMDVQYAYVAVDNSLDDLTYLKSRGVSEFVHFTAADNIGGILNQGLLPRASLDAKESNYISTDNLRLEGKGVVNLSITNPNIKMFYGKRKDLANHVFVVLTLSPELLQDTNGHYSFRATNAASCLSQPCSVEEVFAGDRPDFFESNWPTDNQAELLISGGIDPRYITSVQFPYSEMSNPRAVEYAEQTAALVNRLGLDCDVLFCERHFDYNKSFLGQL